jgi:Zyg-11 family protein
MTNQLPSKRPICEVILNEKHLWALNENELDIENELKSVFESGLEERNSFIYSILESKFIAISVKMIIKNDSNTIKALDVCENKPDFIRKISNHLKDVVISNEMRTTAIDSIVGLMRKYPNFIEMQLNSIVCLYSLIENVLEEIKNPKQIQNAIEVTLKAMELYPNHQQLQKSALIFLYSERVLDKISTERKKCTKLVMDSLINFKKSDMNFMASVICSTNLMELSIEERSELGSNVVYVRTLLNILRVFDNSSYDLIQNILSALVNLLSDSSINCLNFTNLGGLEVAYTLLEVSHN